MVDRVQTADDWVVWTSSLARVELFVAWGHEAVDLERYVVWFCFTEHVTAYMWRRPSNVVARWQDNVGRTAMTTGRAEASSVAEPGFKGRHKKC